MSALLELQGLAKHFGGVAATDGVSLAVRAGEILALIGPNGAGKTTLVAQISGLLRPDDGLIRFEGADITRTTAHARVRLGLARAFQITSIFRGFTVLENLALAVQARSGTSLSFWRPAASDAALQDEARHYARLAGLAGSETRIAGALALSGVSVVDAKILTLANGMALDTFAIQDFEGKPLVEADKQARVRARIVATLEGRVRLNQEFAAARARSPARVQALEVPPRVIIDNTASKVCSVVEVNGHDRPGFLFDVTKAITDLGLQIASAHISTYGERVVDVFYVKDVFGMKVEHETKIRQIREGLGKAIGVAAADVSVESRAGPAAAE